MLGLGDRLARLAQVLGIEQRELAKVGGVSPESFAKYRSGAAYPRLEPLHQWIKELGLNANWLILGEEPMFRGEKTQPQGRKPQEDLVVVRAERIAKLMETYGASHEEIRDAIMAALRADIPSASEPKSLCALHEPTGKYEEK